MPPIEYTIYLLILASGFILGLLQYKRNPQLQPVIVLLGITFVSETTSWILRKTTGYNTPLYHVFTPVQIILWAAFFLRTIRNERVRKSVYVLATGLILFSIANSLLWQGWKKFPDNVLKLESVFLVYLGIVLFLQLLDEPISGSFFRNPLTVVVIALLWFNLVSFLFFQLQTYFWQNQLSGKTLRTLHYVSNYVFYTLILAAIIVSNYVPAFKRK